MVYLAVPLNIYFMKVNYINGNVEVSLDTENGTKIRKWSGDQVLEFPESLDVKITDNCDLGCPYCHESSSPDGAHCNVDELLEKLSDLPKGIELAIGGGNPLSHPDLYKLLTKCKENGWFCSVTVNQIHLNRDEYFFLLRDLIRRELVYGIGVSLKYPDRMTENIDLLEKYSDNIVIHSIAGVNTVDQIIELSKHIHYVKLLILGYKKHGKGVGFYSENVDKNILEWESSLPELSKICNVLSFDNLSIHQLNVKDKMNEDEWNKRYMGDDFTTSMYVDAVKGEYSKTSVSDERIDWNSMGLIDYFKNDKSY